MVSIFSLLYCVLIVIIQLCSITLLAVINDAPVLKYFNGEYATIVREKLLNLQAVFSVDFKTDERKFAKYYANETVQARIPQIVFHTPTVDRSCYVSYDHIVEIPMKICDDTNTKMWKVVWTYISRAKLQKCKVSNDHEDFYHIDCTKVVKDAIIFKPPAKLVRDTSAIEDWLNSR